MDDFKVDIRLPREGDADPSRLVVSGDEDAVFDCGVVAIKFPEPNSSSDLVTGRGPVDDIEKAVKLLTELSDEKQLSGVRNTFNTNRRA